MWVETHPPHLPIGTILLKRQPNTRKHASSSHDLNQNWKKILNTFNSHSLPHESLNTGRSDPSFWLNKSMHLPELVNLTWAATASAVHQHCQQYLGKVCVPKGSGGVCAHSLLWTGKTPHLPTQNSDQISSKPPLRKISRTKSFC